MKAKTWLRSFLILILAFLFLIGGLMVWIDPFFHYHAPLSGIYYTLGDQRSQNDGITKHFAYNAVITGTSMTENFKTSELDELFGTESIKVPYPGGTYKEINDNLEVAFETHDDIKLVIRGLDYTHLIEDKDAMRTDMGTYPTYLYDDNLLNDVKYLYNNTALAVYALPELLRYLRGEEGGHTSFDDYSATNDETYSADEALKDADDNMGEFNAQESLTEEEIQTLTDNVTANVIEIAQANPDTEFICFFPPYSGVWWGNLLAEGTLEKQVAAEELATKLMLESCDNIRVFSFNMETDIVTNLSNYRDAGHYSSEISSWILQQMKAGNDEITLDNMDDYAKAQIDFYENFDYSTLRAQAEEQ